MHQASEWLQDFWIWFWQSSTFQVLYASGIRAPIFTGFFTLSSFLLAAKAFIVINIKREVYDSEAYKGDLSKQRTVNAELSHYGPLIRLSGLLYRAILLALFTAAAQLTIGLMPYNGPALICVLLAVVSFCCVVRALLRVRDNVMAWLEMAERQSELDRKAALQATGA